MRKILASVSITLILTGLIDLAFEEKPKQDPFDKPYAIKILNDHQVQLASKSDTLILFLENSAAFNDEYVVFISKK